MPQIRFNFTTIGDLQSVEKDTTTDVIGILKDVGETSQIVSKGTGKPYDKRELNLVDNTGYSVRLTLPKPTVLRAGMMHREEQRRSLPMHLCPVQPTPT